MTSCSTYVSSYRDTEQRRDPLVIANAARVLHEVANRNRPAVVPHLGEVLADVIIQRQAHRSRSSNSRLMAVNCLEVEAIRKTVSDARSGCRVRGSPSHSRARRSSGHPGRYRVNNRENRCGSSARTARRPGASSHHRGPPRARRHPWPQEPKRCERWRSSAWRPPALEKGDLAVGPGCWTRKAQADRRQQRGYEQEDWRAPQHMMPMMPMHQSWHSGFSV